MYIGNMYTDRPYRNLDFLTAEYIYANISHEFEGQYANKLPSEKATTPTHNHELLQA